MDDSLPTSSRLARYDVVIAGGGPVGLFLACELRLAGLSVLVLEQAKDPYSPFKQLPFGMRGLSVPTIEAFYRRGLLSDLAALQPAIRGAGGGSDSGGAHWMRQQRRPGGHFAGIQFFLDRIDTSKWAYRLPSPADSNMVSDMERIETALAARASAMGIEIKRGHGVDGLEQSDDEVIIRTDGKTLRGQWLVGCDGGRSIVRKAGGFEFA